MFPSYPDQKKNEITCPACVILLKNSDQNILEKMEKQQNKTGKTTQNTKQYNRKEQAICHLILYIRH